MKKKWIIAILIIIGLITSALILLGVVFNKEEFEKQQGLTSTYDVAADGTIAYVFYEEGHPGIYLHNDTVSPKDPLVHLEINQEILDISFSPDGKKLAYIMAHKNKEADLKSAINVIHVDSVVDEELVAEETLVTEIEYHPTNEDFLYYLKAGTFENYSPIASARPHDFDLFSYQISKEETKQHTHMKKYMMQSLQVSEKENVAFVSMFDDEHAETADDIFAAHQRIFQIALDDSNANHVVSEKVNDKDIYDFTVTPNEDAFIFQAVHDTGEDGIFQYELFSYDRKTEGEKVLTHMREHTSNPVIGPDGETVYFMVDKQFGSSKPDYYLYKMNKGGDHPEEVPLYMK